MIHSPGNTQRPRLRPHNPGLVDRLWYGGGSGRSVRWAGKNGLNLLCGNIVTGEHTDDFGTAQLTLIEEYRRLVDPARPARVAVGRVIVPFDSADRATRERYRRYAASRHERTLAPQGNGAFCSPRIWSALPRRSSIGCGPIRCWPIPLSCAWSCPTSSIARITNRSCTMPAS
ncbi:hypothetical protein [Nocardia sp. NBC_01388]|uniref:hypothetical protein n=1 Tax=Nocardia sp. NBC_01388 TaxID=2903596 RepID=UPI0032545956